MNKKEFLDELEKKIRVLDKKEISDILDEYSQHIDMRMESGLSEDEAIKDFGDMDELAAEILEAYHVDPEYDSAGKQDGIGKKAEALAGEITSTVKGPLKRFFIKCREMAVKFARWIKSFFVYEEDGAKTADSEPASKFRAKADKMRRKADRIEQSGIKKIGKTEYKYMRKAEKAERRHEIKAEKRELKNMKKAARIASAGERHEKRKGRVSNIMGAILSFCVSIIAIFCLIPVTIAAAFSVFGLGISLVMLFGGYPIAGIFIALLGATVAAAALWLFLASFVGRRHKKYLVREYVYDADEDFIKANKDRRHNKTEENDAEENEASDSSETEKDSAEYENEDETEDSEGIEEIEESGNPFAGEETETKTDAQATEDERRKRIAKEYLIEEGEDEK